MLSGFQSVVHRLLQRHPEGMGLTDVMLALDCTHYQASTTLRHLKAEGLAGTAPGLKWEVLWAAHEHLPQLAERIHAARKAAAAANRRRTSPRHLTPEQRQAEEAAAAEFVAAPIRREVVEQARWVGQVVVPGPTSVFDLGRAA